MKTAAHSQAAKLFKNGRSQAVRLPAAFRFEGVSEVHIRRDEMSGDVILSKKPSSMDEFFALLRDLDVPKDFPYIQRGEPTTGRDPFANWQE